ASLIFSTIHPSTLSIPTGIKVILDLTPNYLGKQEWFGINFNGTDGDQDVLREKEAFHFWLQKGVDGLQLGGIEQVLASTPSRFLEWQNLTRNYSADSKERVLIGATGVTELQEIVRQQNISDADLLSSGYLRHVLEAPPPLSSSSVWRSLDAYITGIGKSWPCWGMGGSYHMASLDSNLAGLLPVMLYTLPGTPFIYYGDEIGLQPAMPNQDPWMMWNSSENAGFTSKSFNMGKPSLNETVEGQKADGTSRLSLFKKLGLLKVKERSLQFGEAYSVLLADGVLAYVRSWDQSDRFLVLLNFGQEPATTSMAGLADMPAKATVEVSSLGTRPNHEIDLHDIKLAAGEGLVLKFPFVA
ncbi:4F2 cell-surface antigen heavy chain-like, partial [Leucoraja erinacea]|uniref:4F2 cell-surface antigen heavy chain-like n=1 Tax=Leucoraja erinaceus TaxID=7782 RepID=UPI0024560258